MRADGTREGDGAPSGEPSRARRIAIVGSGASGCYAIEALLKGEKLIPYWRLGDGGGVNLARMFTDPAPIDVKDWIQGSGALPYLEQGETVSPENWRAFEGMMGGEAMLMSIWLN